MEGGPMSWLAVRNEIGPMDDCYVEIKALVCFRDGVVTVLPRECVRVDPDGTVWQLYRKVPGKRLCMGVVVMDQ